MMVCEPVVGVLCRACIRCMASFVSSMMDDLNGCGFHGKLVMVGSGGNF